MHRNSLLDQLTKYKEKSLQEDQKIADRFIEFVKEYKDCFERTLKVGHLTGSSLLLNEEENACLFTLHKKLNKWLQLGGHADGEVNLLQVSIKEAQEESGILDIIPLSEEIFDLDIHTFPKTSLTQEHLHYDVRFVLKVSKITAYTVSDESIDLKWISLADFEKYNLEPSILRMRDKLKKANLASF